jgi:hypothetical protein
MKFILAFASLVLAEPAVWIIENGLKTNPKESTKIAVSVCSGLFNRNPAIAGASYTLERREDIGWLELSFGKTYTVMKPKEFIAKCIDSGLVKGYINYDYQTQTQIVPMIITMAGVLDALPLESSQRQNGTLPLTFDSLKEFNNFTAYDATKYVFEKFGRKTTALSKMNPGLHAPANQPWKPEMTRPAALGLTDYIVKARLFNFFMWFSCTPTTKEHELMEIMTKSKIWAEPIRVYGYDNSWEVFGGSIYEAETTCVSSHNMGQIATENVNNLSFFSRNGPITTPLVQNKPKDTTYDPSKTYISFVIGDGDNVNFVKSTRRSWMESRVSHCQEDKSKRGCFPLIWSISPHLLYAAPDILEWFYEQSYITGNDYFTLPPSGDLYSYPSLMPPDVQAKFVANTENSARLLGTNALVGWEWTGSWMKAFNNYFPRYTEKNVIQAIFAVNVPYLIPILAFPFWDTYRIVNDKLVVFKPREWRGTDEREPKKFFLSEQNMANEINGYKKGTVTHIYTTSDGGFNYETLFRMIEKLGDHVEIVDSKTLVKMALQRKNKI